MHLPMQQVTFRVYTKPRCAQCSATFNWLSRRGVGGIEIDDPGELVGAAQRAGVASAPVVEVVRDGKIAAAWGGFRPDLIDRWALEDGE